GEPRPTCRRYVAIGERDGGFGDRPSPLGPRPGKGDDPVSRVRRSVDADHARALAVIDPKAADPADEPVDVERPFAGRDVGTEADEGMPTGGPLAVPGPASTECDLDLDHRLEPIDVGPFEQSDLDHAHGARRIVARSWPKAPRATPRLTPWRPSSSRAPASPRRSSTRSRRPSSWPSRPTSATSSGS